jgi:hypothetical protein
MEQFIRNKSRMVRNGMKIYVKRIYGGQGDWIMGKAGVKNYVPFVQIRMVREGELPYAMEKIDGPEKVVAFTRKSSNMRLWQMRQGL